MQFMCGSGGDGGGGAYLVANRGSAASTEGPTGHAGDAGLLTIAKRNPCAAVEAQTTPELHRRGKGKLDQLD